MRLRHLLLATSDDSYDPRAWSGTPFAIRTALERQVERLAVFGPGAPARNPVDVVKRVVLGGARYPLWITAAAMKQNSRRLAAAIAQHKPDGVLAISSASLLYLPRQKVPIVSITDAPYQSFQEAYKGTISVPDRLGWYFAQDAQVARRLDGLCYASQWGVDEALRLFGARSDLGGALADRLHVTPMGANWVPELPREEVLARAAGRPIGNGVPLELLFLGRDWERKGGPLAVEIAAELIRRGQPVRLHVVGCEPVLPAETAAFTTVHGGLFRENPEQAARLRELLLRSHFLVTPTTAECFGIGFAEAQAFALPPVSRDLQALPSVVVDGVTGLLCSPDAPASLYVDRMLALLATPGAYVGMTVAARERFERVLNWDVMAGSVLGILDGLVKG